MTERFLNTEQVRDRLVKSNLPFTNIKTVQRMMAVGEIPGFKMGGEWRMTESQLIGWMKALEKKP